MLSLVVLHKIALLMTKPRARIEAIIWEEWANESVKDDNFKNDQCYVMRVEGYDGNESACVR